MRTFLFLVSAVAITNAGPVIPKTDLDWWKKVIFYQIYPRSFKDSILDGDGVGDLFDVDPTYGTLEDFDALLMQAKLRGIKVILDMVPNHSSDEHDWFVQSKSRIEPYTDYYIWRDGDRDEFGNRIPPNNWEDAFGGESAWEWNEERQQYYLHQFHVKQPDLNYDNSAVVDEMKDVLRFWLDRGVDGFRMTSVECLYEDPYDEVRPTDRFPKKHLLQTYDIVKQWRILLEEYSKTTGETKVLILQTSGAMDEVMEYYGSPTEPGCHLAVNLEFTGSLNVNLTAYDFVKLIKGYLARTDNFHWPTWMFGSQDLHRVASRFGAGLVDAVNMMLLLLPGAGFTYYGEELGMEDTPITWEETLDPLGRIAGPDQFSVKTRDVARTPFQWDDTVNSGFSLNWRTWLPVHHKYETLNYEKQRYSAKSHWRVYRDVLSFRKPPTFKKEDCQVYAFTENVFAFTRPGIIVVINLGNVYETVELWEYFMRLPETVTVAIPCTHCSYNKGDTLPIGSLLALPKQGVVFTY
ncbi:Maltase A3 [Blattella germanica]|nr:Maltase A3 [Blattella germanica]